MPIVPVSVSAIDEHDNAVRLARYAQIIEFPECALWGVRNSDDDLSACQRLWSHQERVTMAHYLNEAQIEIEQVCGYPLSPKWFADEQARYQWRSIKTKYTKLLATGVRAVADISVGETVDHTGDPAIVTVNGVGALDPNEVRIYHPGTDAEITPSSIDVTAGVLTIEIPRCRLVLAASENTPSDGLDYADTSNFEQAVDVKRVYTDDSTQGTLVYPHGKRCSCTVQCDADTDDACLWIRDAALGFVDARKAELVGSTWTMTTCSCGCAPSYVLLNYQAGLTELTSDFEEAIVSLAHAKRSRAPCGCDKVMEMWKEARTIMEFANGKMPFGLPYYGAFRAMDIATRQEEKRASVL